MEEPAIMSADDYLGKNREQHPPSRLVPSPLLPCCFFSFLDDSRCLSGGKAGGARVGHYS